ncbi:MAG: ATP-binding protein, partial [Thermomicrobium sp.]|nr:ATP-binding protein [Thermomicrobium sp.]
RVEAQIAALTERMERVEAQIAALTERMGRAEEQIVELTHRVTDLTVRMDRVEERLERVEGRLDQVEGRLDRVEGRLERVERDVGRLKGLVLPLVIERRLGGLFRAIVRRPRLVSDDELTAMVEEAEDQGLLSNHEAEHLLLADLVLEGHAVGDSGQRIYVVCEVSWGVGPTDIVRVRERAALLSRIRQQPVLAAVMGAWLTREGEDMLGDIPFLVVPESIFD